MSARARVQRYQSQGPCQRFFASPCRATASQKHITGESFDVSATGKAKMGAASRFVSASALSRHLTVSREEIARLTEAGVLQRRDGKYDEGACRAAFIAHLRSRHSGTRAEAEAQLIFERAAYYRVRRLERLNLLVDAREFTEFVHHLAGIHLTVLNPFAARCFARDAAGTLTNGEARRIVDAGVRRALDELADATVKLSRTLPKRRPLPELPDDDGEHHAERT